MFALYSMAQDDQEGTLITASENLYHLMEVADAEKNNMFFMVKRITDDGTNQQVLLGSRIGLSEDVMWRRSVQEHSRKRDYAFFDSLRRLFRKS